MVLQRQLAVGAADGSVVDRRLHPEHLIQTLHPGPAPLLWQFVAVIGGAGLDMAKEIEQKIKIIRRMPAGCEAVKSPNAA